MSQTQSDPPPGGEGWQGEASAQPPKSKPPKKTKKQKRAQAVQKAKTPHVKQTPRPRPQPVPREQLSVEVRELRVISQDENYKLLGCGGTARNREKPYVRPDHGELRDLVFGISSQHEFRKGQEHLPCLRGWSFDQIRALTERHCTYA